MYKKDTLHICSVSIHCCHGSVLLTKDTSFLHQKYFSFQAASPKIQTHQHPFSLPQGDYPHAVPTWLSAQRTTYLGSDPIVRPRLPRSF